MFEKFFNLVNEDNFNQFHKIKAHTIELSKDMSEDYLTLAGSYFINSFLQSILYKKNFDKEQLSHFDRWYAEKVILLGKLKKKFKTVPDLFKQDKMNLDFLYFLTKIATYSSSEVKSKNITVRVEYRETNVFKRTVYYAHLIDLDIKYAYLKTSNSKHKVLLDYVKFDFNIEKSLNECIKIERERKEIEQVEYFDKFDKKIEIGSTILCGHKNGIYIAEVEKLTPKRLKVTSAEPKLKKGYSWYLDKNDARNCITLTENLRDEVFQYILKH